MIEQDARTGEQAVALAVVDRDPVAVGFGGAVGTARPERGLFVLRLLAHVAEHLAANWPDKKRIVGSTSRMASSMRSTPSAGELGREHAARRNWSARTSARPDCRPLAGRTFTQQGDDRRLIQQVGLMQRDPIGDCSSRFARATSLRAARTMPCTS